ncbi:serine/threonine protein kinase (Kin4) [Purpureocillium lavendulum]|uniref:Serine/threonine protein kinase (Kin4) n=1 Tax=Purpureocillium lavendulum TaxID=1247861 RepID=A0AB34FY10_9HYPO|nr:serine/threonine protein kinase (Kin4) [Purpureocillium lavendulum]
MTVFCLWLAALAASPLAFVAAAPVGPTGPCDESKVDAILKGEMDPSECCSYGKCKGRVVVSVGE